MLAAVVSLAALVACGATTESDSAPSEVATTTTPAPPRASAVASPVVPSVAVVNQMRALGLAKGQRTKAERKLDSQLLLESQRRHRDPLALSLAATTAPGFLPDGNVLVDIVAAPTGPVVRRLLTLGGRVRAEVPGYDAIRAELALDAVLQLAEQPEVRRVQLSMPAVTHKLDTSQADLAHAAKSTRLQLGIDGTGVTIGVLSDGVNTVAARQATGDLPSGAQLAILPGQAGTGDEGTALMEIIYDLAPGATLRFATAFTSPAQFAQNILDLRAAGADIIVDDVSYLGEGAFQDGPIAQAVQSVTNQGALYFSAAGNEGNAAHGSSGVYEGDFAPTSAFGSDAAHLFQAGVAYDTVTRDPTTYVTLQWSDQLAASANDYDLFLLSADGSQLLAASTDLQNGTGDPFEAIDSTTRDDRGNLVVIVRDKGAQRNLRLNTHGGQLAVGTNGQVFGHVAAENAFAVAAIDVANANGGPFLVLPNQSGEVFNTDGPRKIFYAANGAPVTPGNYLSSGGLTRLKPDLTTADGVVTSTPGFSPFYGTSASAGHAAGLAALVLQRRPQLAKLGDVRATTFMRALLNSTAIDIETAGVDNVSGPGIFMADLATKPCAGPTDGEACDDANACTQTDSCQAGACVGQRPVMCTALDQCHVAGICNPSDGTCSNPIATDATPCDDQSACTGADSCQAGACTGTTLACAATDACHLEGTCDPTLGCSDPVAPDGTLCTSGACQMGTCIAATGEAGAGSEAAAHSDGGSGGEAGNAADSSAGVQTGGGSPTLGGSSALSGSPGDAGGEPSVAEAASGGKSGGSHGCGCSVPGQASSSSSPWFAMAALLMVASHRTRRRNSARRQ